MSTKDERAALWSSRIAEQRASGLSQPAFCRERNISFSTFCSWRSRLNKKSAVDAGWINISAADVLAIHKSITVRVGRAVIDLSPGFDPELLRDVVAALAPC
jgi:hypothetical protein